VCVGCVVGCSDVVVSMRCVIFAGCILVLCEMRCVVVIFESLELTRAFAATHVCDRGSSIGLWCWDTSGNGQVQGRFVEVGRGGAILP